jgi:ABC-type nickel/cobalt efflux system permease component RcnA
MTRIFLLGVAVAALALPAAALAHPLGNFTINRYSRIEPSGGRIYVLYVLDMAEIPTFQAKSTVSAEGTGAYAQRLARSIGRGLELSVDGRPIQLHAFRHALAFPPGQAGLHTTRLEAVYRSDPLRSGTPARLDYRDTNFAGRIGWKEIVLKASSGARVDSASVPSKTISDELRSYPKDLLQSPLDVTEARAEIVPGSGSGVPPAVLSGKALQARVGVRAVTDSGFASLIAKDKLSTGFVLLSLLIAVFWGAAHALSPGHGKSVVAAYLVGSRGTARHAALLGVTVTVTHTIGVFALGLVTLALSAFLVPEQLYPWLNLLSALLVVVVGLGVLRWRLREWMRSRAQPAHLHKHDHEHGHDHADGHTHGDAHEQGCGCHGDRHPEPGMSVRQLLGVGISGGLIPCPTALVVLLAAISLHRVGYGLVLILAFSVGLAAAMTSIGLLAVTAKRAFSRLNFEGGALRLLPAISALVIVGLGLAMTARALPKIV